MASMHVLNAVESYWSTAVASKQKTQCICGCSSNITIFPRHLLSSCPGKQPAAWLTEIVHQQNEIMRSMDIGKSKIPSANWHISTDDRQ